VTPWIRAALLLSLATSHAAAGWFSDALAADESVQLATTTAKQESATTISVRVHAWVYEREPRRGALPLFAKYLGVDREQMSTVERARFEQRARLFLVDVESGKKLNVSSASGALTAMPKTNRFGVSKTLLSAPAPSNAGMNGVDFYVQGPEQRFVGRAILVGAQGLSVVSDIDDTIRNTQVLDRKEMLLNTFVRELTPVPGMSALYQKLAENQSDTRFHYVSNAPFALYPLVQEFLATEQFPEGSMHLRAVSLKSSLWHKLFDANTPSSHKLETISALIDDFPERQFVLIGDTGEFDPEIYAQVATRFPQQVSKIWLHEVQPDQASSTLKIEQIMQDVPRDKWQLFSSADEISLFSMVNKIAEPGQ
jgi:phosphatidate phosphatase APP1